MIDLEYSLVIAATAEADFFGFYSPDLEGFTGVGHSVEDCIYKARSGMADHVETLRQQKLPVPTESTNPTITIRNEARLERCGANAQSAIFVNGSVQSLLPVLPPTAHNCIT